MQNSLTTKQIWLQLLLNGYAWSCRTAKQQCKQKYSIILGGRVFVIAKQLNNKEKKTLHSTFKKSLKGLFSKQQNKFCVPTHIFYYFWLILDD